MISLKDRLKNYALWVSLIALIPMLCEGFGINVLPANYEELSMAILGILVLLGLVNNPTTQNRGYKDDKRD